MKFDFNTNINESSISNQAYKKMVDYYTRTKQYKKLQDFIAKYNSLQQTQPTYDQPINSIDEEQPSEYIKMQQLEQKDKEISNSKFAKIIKMSGIDNLAFKNALLDIADAHEKIVDLYEYTLYEDTWNEVTINKFEELLEKYNTSLSQLQSMLPSIEWKSEINKHEFMKIYKELIKADADSWNRVYARHNNYLRYRTNRRSIISQIADIIGGIKNTKDANYQDIFKYFNNKCADIRLYDNSNKSERKDILSLWLKPHLNEVMDEMKDRGIFNGAIDSVDIFKVFRIYVKCRKLAYAIFNLMTSNSEYNGYDKWHNRFVDYCDATLNDRQLELLINAVDAENQFEEVDDYQNIMDEQTWEAKGIYESWFDDSLEYYQSHKERYNKSKINKINMVPTNVNQCRVTCDGKNVYANATFYPGDIIEICPTKKIDKSALYSKDMRESVFEVVPNEEWVLPYGYCKFYLSDNLGDGNCNYIWDPVNRVIVIKAINKISKYSKLLLNIQL